MDEAFKKYVKEQFPDGCGEFHLHSIRLAFNAGRTAEREEIIECGINMMELHGGDFDDLSRWIRSRGNKRGE